MISTILQYKPIIPSNGLVNIDVFDTNENLLFNTSINYDVNKEIDYYSVINQFDNIQNNKSYIVKLYKTNYLNYDLFVNDYSPNFKEIEIKVGNDSSKVINDLNNHFSNGIPVYLMINNENPIIINNYFFDTEYDSLFVLLENKNTTIQITDFIQLYTIEMETFELNFSFQFVKVIKSAKKLIGHRKDFESFNLKKQDTNYISTDEISETFKQLSQKDYFDKQYKNKIDYSKFENHVFFGSSLTKIINADNKFKKIRELGFKIGIKHWVLNDIPLTYFRNDWSNYFNKLNVSESVNRGITNELIEKLDSLSDYEMYLFINYFTTLPENKFLIFIQEQKEIAEEYDILNPNFILLQFPENILNQDNQGFFTNFILVYAEFFDYIRFNIKSIENIKNINPSDINHIDYETSIDVLTSYGFDDAIGYDSASLFDYLSTSIGIQVKTVNGEPVLDGNGNYEYESVNNFESELGYNTLKTLSKEVSIRLLNNLTLLYKSKGTLSVVKEILNIFGIPNGLLSIYETGTFRQTITSKTETFNSENAWYYSNKNNHIESINISSSAVNTNNFTVELVINDFINSSGSLVKFNDENELLYSASLDTMSISLYNSGSVVYTKNLPVGNDYWQFLGYTKNGLTGSFYASRQDNNGRGLIDESIETFYYNNLIDSFSDIKLLNSSSISITEFRIFNSSLDTDEFKAHAMDFRSIAEKENDISLLSRFYFHQVTGSILPDILGSYQLTLTTSSVDNFKSDVFYYRNDFDSLDIDTLPSTHVVIENRPNTNNLSKDHRIIEDTVTLSSNKNLNVVISPSSIINKQILRNYGFLINLTPNDYDENSYLFEELEKNKYLLRNISIFVPTFDYFIKIYNILNQNVFTILKKFIPIGVHSNIGLMVKNNILTKKRNKPLKRNVQIHSGYLFDVPDAKIDSDMSIETFETNIVNNNLNSDFDFENLETNIQNITVDVSSIMEQYNINLIENRTVLKNNTIPYIEKTLFVKQKYIQDYYNKRTFSSLKTKVAPSGYFKNLFRGYNIINGLGVQIKLLPNAGATILVQ